MNYYNNILELVGKTPIIKLNKIGNKENVNLFVKMEAFNPGSSVKDRIALNMIEEAEKNGLLKKDSHIVEPTSGNTGIGLSLVSAVKGYKITLTMPESMSVERRKILKAFGANIVLTPASEGMKGAINKAKEIGQEDPYVFIPEQFKNLANPMAHEKTTAVEIWEDLDGKVDAFISGIGTGGTITGAGRKLKELNPNIKIVGVEPENSAVLSGEQSGPHKIQGIGAGFIPDVLNTEIYDEIVKVSNEESYEHSRELAKKEGIFVGISSGAALAASIKYIKKSNLEGNIVVILPDTGERYLSTELWD